MLNCLPVDALAGALEERLLGTGERRFSARGMTVFPLIKVVFKLPLC
jgi:hypothetical protein